MSNGKIALVALAGLGGFGCEPAPVDEVGSLAQRVQIPADAAVILGAEDPARWRAEAGPAPTASSDHTQGAAAISVTPPYYTRYFSDVFPSTGAIREVKLDFFMTAQASQWKGNLELEMMCPSQNMNWEWIGQVPLTGEPEQQWFEASFPLSQGSQNKLFGVTCASLELRLIVNPGVGGTRFAFDNVRLVGLPPGAACAIDADCDSGNCDGGFCGATPPLTTFAKILYEEGSEFTQDVDPTSDGGYIVSGFDEGDARLLKLNALGNVVWQRAYDLGWSEVVYDACELPGGGYALAGYQYQPDTQWRMWVARTDAEGNLLSATRIDDLVLGTINAVEPGPDGSLYVAGTAEIGGEWPHAMVARLDASDHLVWATDVAGVQSSAQALTISRDGSIVATGGVTGPRRLLIARVAADGTLLWSNGYGAEVNAGGLDVIQTSDGNYLAGGEANFSGYVVKVSPSGAVLWSTLPSVPVVVGVDEYAGEYSLTGRSTHPDDGTFHIPRIAILSTGGVETFATDIEDPLLPGITLVVDGERTADGGWLMTGSFYDPTKEFVWDGFVAKTDASGQF